MQNKITRRIFASAAVLVLGIEMLFISPVAHAAHVKPAVTCNDTTYALTTAVSGGVTLYNYLREKRDYNPDTGRCVYSGDLYAQAVFTDSLGLSLPLTSSLFANSHTYTHMAQVAQNVYVSTSVVSAACGTANASINGFGYNFSASPASGCPH
jgi:dihydroxyacid dehydratase/phosphogluconate dehydratase